MGSKNIVILLDSIERDADYIKNMRNYRFDRIDIIYQPTGKYEGYDAIINLHQRENYEGYEGNVEAFANSKPQSRIGTPLSVTTGRGGASFTKTTNKWNYVVSVNGEWTQTGNSLTTSSLYPLNNIRENTIVTDKRPTNEKIIRSTSAMAAVDYQMNKNHSFSFMWNMQVGGADHWDKNNTIVTDLLTGTSHNAVFSSRFKDRGMLSNTFSLYYRGKSHGWSYNVNGSYYHMSRKNYNQESRSSGFVMEDNRRKTTDFAWGGGNISRISPNHKWMFSASNYLYYTNYTETRIGGSFLTNSKNWQNKTILSAQFIPDKKWSLAAKGGVEIRNNSSDGEKKVHFTPILGASASYSANQNLAFRLNYTTTVTPPTLSQQQNYGQFTDSLIWQQGNPLIAPTSTHDVQLYASLFRFLNMSLRYNYSHNAIWNMATTGDGLRPDGLTGPYVNYTWNNYNAHLLQFNISLYKSFGKHWDASMSAKGSWHRVKAQAGQHSSFCPYVQLYGSYYLNSLRMVLSYYIEKKPYITPQQFSMDTSDAWALAILKTFKDWEITVLYFLPLHFTDGKIHDTFNSAPLKIESLQNDRFRNDNAIQLTITYRFQGGKSVRKYNRPTESVQ